MGKPDLTPLDQIIGANIKRLREARGWGQEKVAEAFKCSVPHLSTLENGKRAFKTKWIYAAMNLFDVPAGEFVNAVEMSSSDKKLFKDMKEYLDLKSTSKK